MLLPLIAYNPKRQGSHALSPVEKLNCCHIFASHYSLFCDTIFEMTPSDLVQVSTGLALSGSGKEECGLQPGQKSQKENEHFTFNCSPFGKSFSAASEKDSRQTHIAGVLSLFPSSIVELICSGIILDAGCHVSY